MNIKAHIDLSKAQKSKIMQELKRKTKIVEIKYPMPVGEDGLLLKTYSLEESFEKLWDKMSDHCGFQAGDIKTNWQPQVFFQ